MKPRLLIVTANEVGLEMRGPGIRAYELARALQPHAEVTLGHRASDMEPVIDVECVPFAYADPVALKPHIASADAIFGQPQFPNLARWLVTSDALLIHDLYGPEQFEALQGLAQGGSTTLRMGLRVASDRILEAMHTGHHLVCASERQRDLWIGAMLAEGLIRPELYRRDPTLRSVIDTVPFGLPREPPERNAPGPREVFGLGGDAEIALWNGGIWNWLDAPTAIRAVAALAPSRPIHLVFMFASNPAADRAIAEARALTSELGLTDRIHFTDALVPYGERAAWMLDADCSVYAHADHLETRYAFRTRILDSLWARLPIVCTAGDHFADQVESEGWGATAAPGSSESFAAALTRVLGNPTLAREMGRAGRKRVEEKFSWASVAERTEQVYADAIAEFKRASGD
jgi:hypothetical protein